MWRGGGRRGAATWRRAVVGAGRLATPQPEHMPTRWCLGFAGRRRRDGDKTPVCAADNQGPQNNRQPVFVGEEEDQAQELAVDAARGRHARRQESHVSVVAICVTTVADLVGSGVLEEVIRVVGVAELALMLPYLTSADEIVAKGDGHQQIGLLRHADVSDFEIGAAVALTREHPLVSGGETSVVTNALQRPHDMVVRAGPIRSMMEAGVDVVPAPSPPMKYRWQWHGTFAKGARAGLSVSPRANSIFGTNSIELFVLFWEG
jgi:hypothetical protein